MMMTTMATMMVTMMEMTTKSRVPRFYKLMENEFHGNLSLPGFQFAVIHICSVSLYFDLSCLSHCEVPFSIGERMVL